MKLKTLCTFIGAVGAGIVSLLGGWDTSIQTLLIFIAADYITGLIVAGVFHNSTKTTTGTLESRAGFKGLVRKCMILVFVMIANRLDLELGTDYFRNFVIIGFMANEAISITENAGLMGIQLPEPIYNAIDILKERGSRND
jgi:toxin secretion/phage lysis holin